ncbi:MULTISPECIES: cytosine permease [unclassified Pseudonocardia]|uniref:purine-cytosine permease family protein n=1 Tax=unclassified Pseudonocardia TaxID=2619320 RepID=UPI00095F847F|nr:MULTISPECIES: cytosine permease [unclassified Pseudonocardia]MBN9098344.1 cytosine permease [Pseudonocardia sp.]OJY52585.1 MAG: cytosine permease [Pseudonocardia sp. 73-21]
MTVPETSSARYGERIVAVEPGGNERVPDADRHALPRQLFWTWTSPNMEFATIFVGVLAVSVFGMTFGQAVTAILLGNVLASLAHGVLSARGPSAGVPQMVLGRLAFGYRGNVLPSGLMTITSGFGWFAVNSVSASFALSSLTGASPVVWLVIVVLVQVAIAFFGHNLVQAFERLAFPVLAVIFLIGAVIVLTRSDASFVPADGGSGGVGGFLLTVGAVFGYTAGWTPYAADYSRYLPADNSRRRTGLAAGLGMFGSCTILMIVGAASVSAAAAAGITSDNPTTAYVGVLPGLLANLTLLAIAVGAVAANVLNVYSGAMAFLSMGFPIALDRARAVVAAAFGVVGFVIALVALGDAAAGYENFLLVIVYWIGPWLGVVLTDQYLRRGALPAESLYDRTFRNPAGLIALVVGIVVSVGLFANQVLFTGLVPRVLPDIGDIAFLVGIALSAALYAVLYPRLTVRS